MIARRLRVFALSLLAALTLPAAASAQGRFEQSLSLAGGLYAASGVGTNFYSCARYNYFFYGGRSFVEASLGVGSLESKVISAISKAGIFASDNLVTYEFAFGYDASPTGNLPYVLFGVAGVKEGDETHFAPEIGVGKRIPIPGLLGSNALGVRYDVRDQIFSQSINNSDKFVAHNIVVTIGLQLYF
jgi:hypothetical protein